MECIKLNTALRPHTEQYLCSFTVKFVCDFPITLQEWQKAHYDSEYWGNCPFCCCTHPVFSFEKEYKKAAWIEGGGSVFLLKVKMKTEDGVRKDTDERQRNVVRKKKINRDKMTYLRPPIAGDLRGTGLFRIRPPGWLCKAGRSRREAAPIYPSPTQQGPEISS